MNGLKEDIKDTVNNVKDSMADYGHKIKDDVVDLKDNAVDKTDKKYSNYVQNNPWKCISISFLVGFVLSRILKS